MVEDLHCMPLKGRIQGLAKKDRKLDRGGIGAEMRITSCRTHGM